MTPVLDIIVPRALLSPNAWQGRHWRFKSRDTRDWETWIWATMPAKVRTGPPASERRKLTVTRLVPSARQFIRDDDNLAFALKPLADALKRLHLIVDDSRVWLDATVTQERSADGKAYTRLVLEFGGVGLEPMSVRRGGG